MRTSLALLLPLLAVAAGACGDDDQVVTFADAASDATADAIVRADAPVGDPRGGWQMGNLYACFSSSQSADFANSISAVMTMPCCYWDPSGLLYYPNNVVGTWTLDSFDRLVITQDPPCGDACGPFAYERNAAITCQF